MPFEIGISDGGLSYESDGACGRRCCWRVCSLFPCTLTAQSRGLKKVQVGVPAISMGNIVIYFTKEAKIFEKYGLDVEPVAVAGSGIASKALISGSVQISPIATPTVMSSVLAGSDMVILAHTMPGVIQYLMARPDIKRTEDIKGKTIGVTTFGSLNDFLGQVSRAAKRPQSG